MAGCLPDHMPIVVASALAMMDPAFDLAEMQGTTHATAPLIIVNGPARAMCGVASGYGALGPGHRANASIGRAIRLAMINIGGARPGTSDMALLGHGGKFGQCLGEDEAHSPFAPLHTSRGFAAEDSAVTVIGTSLRSRWRTLPEATSSDRANVSSNSWRHRLPESAQTTPGWAVGRP